MKATVTTSGARAGAPAILVTAVALAGCGGGAAPRDTAPKLGALADQVVNQDTTVGPLPVSITQASAQPMTIAVTAVAADSALVPPANVMVDGSGAQRTLTLTPAADATGSTEVTVTVRDAAGNVASRSFRLTVNPVYAGFTQYATTTFETSDTSVPKAVTGLTFRPDADDNANAFTALLQ